MIKKDRPLDIKYILKGVAIGFVILVIGSLFHSDPIPLIVGIVFGLILSLLNFRLLYITLNKAVQLPPGKAQVYASSRYMIRYLITGIVLFVSIQAPYINVLGTIMGLLLLKTMIMISNILNSGNLLKEVLSKSKH
ncbi:ATP synthase subunit I [Irregularibacter muris]|uniref:ATP synthase subunit I n=1 Tax=Irregularibacter muris TaxID=1796619 RepID=A0AAE3L3C4_9FIRM|nr:ATP synthase subunit I [Irregularibacter muris]MCR1900209.1 ATP synthase subunit I [Irregularibacter muris]